ncbi:MAG: hypothetical protein B6I36_09320 [Desulfobacteraceae bacterium 4572_35.1]|nr:MAG: hypothetical protein B6I36_09320 [Desulfobacteraceae bacterium 4572_35.1]
MKCPVCKHSKYVEQGLHSAGFSEEIVECDICGTTWSVNHGMTEVVSDTQEFSFLQSLSENVEADDYNYAGV